MSTAVVAAVAAITVGSRVLALAFVPPPRVASPRFADRLPAPLFAVLAAVHCSAATAASTRPSWAVRSRPSRHRGAARCSSP